MLTYCEVIKKLNVQNSKIIKNCSMLFDGQRKNIFSVDHNKKKTIWPRLMYGYAGMLLH